MTIVKVLLKFLMEKKKTCFVKFLEFPDGEKKPV